MGHATWDEVAAFLRRFKRTAIGPPPRSVIWQTLKNAAALIEIGITRQQRDEILLRLTPEDYCRGPEEDDDTERKGSVWFFGTVINGQEVYIKLKVVDLDPFDQAECLSFHPAERPLTYPFRE